MKTAGKESVFGPQTIEASSSLGFAPSGLQQAHWPPYSTVTDLARFLGWSTSHPRRTAM